MTKLFGRDANNARKQATILIKGSILIAQKASPAPCCHTVTIPSWQARAASPAQCHSSSPECFARAGESLDTAPRSSTWINSDLDMVEEKFPKDRVKSTKKCRCDHSGWLQHFFTTEGSPFLADLVLPGPKQVLHPSPDTRGWHKGTWKEKCQAVL